MLNEEKQRKILFIEKQKITNFTRRKIFINPDEISGVFILIVF